MQNRYAALLCAVLFTSVCAPSVLAQNADTKVGDNFKTDAASVLRALARSAHANIILNESDAGKTMVSARLQNVPFDQAIRQVAAQAGLVCRKVNNTYIVAKPDAMRRILDQTGVRERVDAAPLDTAALATQLEKTFLYLNARAVGNSLWLTGAPDDIKEAKEALSEIQVAAPKLKQTHFVVVRLHFVKADVIATALKKIYPQLVVVPINDNILLLGEKETDSKPKLDLIRKLDRPS